MENNDLTKGESLNTTEETVEVEEVVAVEPIAEEVAQVEEVAVEETVAVEPIAEEVAVEDPSAVEPAEKVKKTKKQILTMALNIAGYVLAIVIVVFTLYISIITITRTSNESALSRDPITNSSFLPVQSDSMMPTFNEGDLVIAKAYDGETELDVGTIVTFRVPYSNSASYYNTHRIVDKAYDINGKFLYYVTMGDKYNAEYNTTNIDDAVDESKTEATEAYQIEATYKSTVKGMGKFVTWLSDTTNYFVLIVVPLIVLFVLYIIYFVRMLMQNKAQKAIAEAKAGVTADSLSEEEKKRLFEEFLAMQQQAPKDEE